MNNMTSDADAIARIVAADSAYADALRQEVEELAPVPEPTITAPPGTVYQSVDHGWTTPRMAVMHVTEDGRGIVPYGVAPLNSDVTCSDGIRRCVRHIDGIVWAEPLFSEHPPYEKAR